MINKTIYKYEYFSEFFFLATDVISFKYVIVFKVKLVTLVESDPKAPLSIATTQRCRGGCYSTPWIAPLYPWFLPEC